MALEPDNRVNDGQWHHFAATHNGGTGTMSLYLDGVLLDSVNEEFGPIDDGGASLNIGISSHLDNQFLGLLDEIKFHNRALSQEEILAMIAADESGG